jgi:hypothetical protein
VQKFENIMIKNGAELANLVADLTSRNSDANLSSNTFLNFDNDLKQFD